MALVLWHSGVLCGHHILRNYRCSGISSLPCVRSNDYCTTLSFAIQNEQLCRRCDTVMSGSMEERLKRRKLDALKRGVHRVGGDQSIPLTTHVVGIGKAGANAICQIIRDLEPDAPKFTALAIDIGDQDLAELRALAAKTPAERAEVTTVALTVPEPEDLFDALSRYGTFLRLEYPNHRWTDTGQPWLPRATHIQAGQHFERAVAKAIYGYAYYSWATHAGNRTADFRDNHRYGTIPGGRRDSVWDGRGNWQRYRGRFGPASIERTVRPPGACSRHRHRPL